MATFNTLQKKKKKLFLISIHLTPLILYTFSKLVKISTTIYVCVVAVKREHFKSKISSLVEIQTLSFYQYFRKI